MMNLTSGMAIEHDFGFTTMDVQDALILREGVRSYTNRNGVLVEQPCMWLQGVTSVPEWNKFGQGHKPSYHFKVHVVDNEGESESIAVSAFGNEVVNTLSHVLEHRQAFVRLKKVDVRQSIITSAFGPTKGSDITVKSLTINFLNQVELLAIFAPKPSTWAMAAEALSKKAEGEVDSCPF